MPHSRFTNPGSHLLSAAISLGVFGVAAAFLRLPILMAAGIGAASYVVALVFIVPAPSECARRQSGPGEIREPVGTQRHLALLIFLGTLIGSLLGALGSVSEIANGLLIPIWEAVFPTPSIRIVGSDTILGQRLGLAQAWQTDFQTINAWEERVPILGKITRSHDVHIEPMGSVAGMQEAQNGRRDVHLLAMSEAISDDQVEQTEASGITFQCAGEIGYDLIVFVTAKNHDITVLSKEELRQILAGEVRDWSEVWPERDVRSRLPITVFARRGSGTTEVVLSALTGSAHFPAHFTACRTNDECLNQALATPGSLYWVSLSWLYMQPFDYLQVLLVKVSENDPPTNPLDATFNPNWYPIELIRPLYLYALKGPKSDAETLAVTQQFFEYVRGVRGQKILEQYHFDTYFSPSSAVHLNLPPGFGRQPDGSWVVCR